MPQTQICKFLIVHMHNTLVSTLLLLGGKYCFGSAFWMKCALSIIRKIYSKIDLLVVHDTFN